MQEIGFTSKLTKETEAAERRRRGIVFLSKINPGKYMAKYVEGKLHLLYNLAYRRSIPGKGRYVWAIMEV